jgi:hypothetical protein
MRITIQVDDADVANEVAESLRHEAESIGIVHPGTANMLRGVADQIENQIEDAIPETVEGRVALAQEMIKQDAYTIHDKFPFVCGAGDYHEFDDVKRVLGQLYNDVNFFELDLETDRPYNAVFYLGDTAPEVTQKNISSFRKVEA